MPRMLYIDQKRQYSWTWIVINQLLPNGSRTVRDAESPSMTTSMTPSDPNETRYSP
jgi:predicted secreted protein